MPIFGTNGRFSGGMNNPNFGGTMQRFNSSPMTAAPAYQTPNPWVREMQNVFSAFGFDPTRFGSNAGTNYTASGNAGPLQWKNVTASGPAGWERVNAPGAVNWERVDPAAMVDPRAMIQAQLPGIREQQDIGFANAASRFGRMGMLPSGSYMESLGGVARKASNDITAMTEQAYQQAAEAAAQRQMEAAMANQQAGLSSNENAASRAMQASLANQSTGYNASESAAQRAQQAALANSQGNMTAQQGNLQWQSQYNDPTRMADLLGNWYLNMRNNDENRTLSQWQGDQAYANQPVDPMQMLFSNPDFLRAYMPQLQAMVLGSLR